MSRDRARYTSCGQMLRPFAHDDHGKDIVVGDVFHVDGPDKLAVLHHARPVAEFHDVVDVMLDQEDAELSLIHI